MSRWARLDSTENNTVVGEIIDYDPQTIINEQLWDRFVPCGDEVTVGFYYNSETQEFYVPEGYGKHTLSDSTFSQVPLGYIVGNDYVFVPDPNYVLPKNIVESDFRSKLTLTEKLLWDNPETGTAQQKAAINTMKLDFSFFSVEDMQDELDLLESLEIVGVGRAAEIASQL
jgi:hypothetical protein